MYDPIALDLLLSIAQGITYGLTIGGFALLAIRAAERLHIL